MPHTVFWYLVLWLCCAAPVVNMAQTEQVDSLLRALDSVNHPSEAHADILNRLSVAYNAYKADSSLLYAEQALSESEQAGYKKGIANAYRNIGFAYQRLGKLASATGAYLRAVTIFEELRDTLGLANTWNGLGICYFEQGDYRNALQFYQRAEPLFLRLGNLERYGAALSNIGYTYLQMGHLNVAKIYAEKALLIGESNRAPSVISFSLSHLGDIARRQSDYGAAEKYFSRCLEIAARYPNNAVANSRMYYQMGYLYTDLKQFIKARMYLDSSLAIALRANMRFRVKDSYQGFQHLYEAMRDFEQAYRYQSLVEKYQDSLFNQESAQQIAAMQREIDLQAQATQISILKKDNEIQQITRNALLGAIAVAIFAGLLLWRAYWQMRKVNGTLQIQNAEILEQRSMVERQGEEIAAINNELEAKNQYLVDMNEEKSQFMRIAAHDLKNPLTGIRGLSEYLALDAAQLPTEEITLIAKRIGQTAERMFQLVKSLLDVNAIESGNFALHPTNFDVRGILENSVQNYMDAAKAKNITLLLTVLLNAEVRAEIKTNEESSEFGVFADEQAMMQILDNLVSNAIKYTPSDKRVFVRLCREQVLNPQQTIDEFVRIEVQDEGPGLTLQDKEHLFGKFTKLSARPTAGEDSTGLGLSIVKHLSQMMNAQVWCESEYGDGAVFILRLPFVASIQSS